MQKAGSDTGIDYHCLQFRGKRCRSQASSPGVYGGKHSLYPRTPRHGGVDLHPSISGTRRFRGADSVTTAPGRQGRYPHSLVAPVKLPSFRVDATSFSL